jgi:hypothetical protein
MGSSTVPVGDWEAYTHRHAVYLNLQMQASGHTGHE